MQNDYLFVQYISFENHIEQNKKEYYKALMTGQKNRGKKTEKIDSWLLFFLNSLEILTIKLEQKYDVFKSKGGYLNERQMGIKEFIVNNQPIKVSDLAKVFSGLQLSTIKKDLQYLREEQEINMLGLGKGSFYISFDKN